MEKFLILGFLFNAFFACMNWKANRNKLAFIPAIPALIGLGTAIYQGIQANKQQKLAKSLSPTSGVPGALKEAEAMARQEAGATMQPGYARAASKINQSRSNAIEGARKLGNANAIRSAVVDNDTRTASLLKDLEVNNEAARSQANQRLQNILLRKGAYQKEADDRYNASVSALRGASAQNNWNAINSLGEGIVRSLPDSYFMAQSQGGANTGRGLNRFRQQPTGTF